MGLIILRTSQISYDLSSIKKCLKKLVQSHRDMNISNNIASEMDVDRIISDKS